MTIILACYFFVIGDYHCLEVVPINEKIATHLRFYRRIIFSNERLFFQRIFANGNAIAECLEYLASWRFFWRVKTVSQSVLVLSQINSYVMKYKRM